MDSVTVFEDTQLGLRPCYFVEGSDVFVPSIAGLFARRLTHTPKADEKGVRQFFDRQPDGFHTCFSGVRKVPLHHALRKRGHMLALVERRDFASVPRTPLLTLIEDALRRILSAHRKPALALSGGLDSALLLALCRRMGADIPIVTLATDFPGYCEREITLATAKALGASDVEAIEASAEDFVAALPDAIAACETPLYNLHPVSRWLLARELTARGFTAIVTGDGADQVFAGSDPRNYMPIVGAMVQAAGITLESPFLDEPVIASARAYGVDADKSALRRAAEEILPDEIVRRPKQPRLAPGFDVSEYRESAADCHLHELLGVSPPPKDAGFANTLWVTATLLFQHLGGLA